MPSRSLPSPPPSPASLADAPHTAELLREANRRLEFHAHNSPLAIVEWDAEFRVVRWSDEAERMFGYAARDVVGMPLAALHLVHPDDEPLIQDVMQSMLTGERPRNVSRNRNVRRDGRVIACEWYNSALLDDEGRLVSVYSQVLDVTDREDTLARERAARDRVTRLQAITSALARARSREEVAHTLVHEALRGMRLASGAVGVLTDDGRSLQVLAPQNMPARFLSGTGLIALDAAYPLTDAARTRQVVIIEGAEDFARRYPQLVAQLGKEPSGAAAAIPLVIDDSLLGSFVLRSEAPRRWTTEELDFLSALAVQCAQAIDRVRLRERELATRDEVAATQRFVAHASRVLVEPLDARETLERFARLVVPSMADSCVAYLVDDEGEPVRVAAADADPVLGAELEAVREANPIASVPSHPMHQVIATGTSYFRREVSDDDLRRAMGSGDVRAAERVGWRSAILLPLIARGRIVGAVGLGRRARANPFEDRDLVLAESLAARAALAVDNAQLFTAAEKARREAEAANRAKSDFLAMMSHELRTPLNAIAGYLDLLRMELRGPLTPDQAGDLDRIDLAQRRLLALINDVLNFAKLEAGRVEFHLRPVTVQELFEAVMPLVEPQMEARGLSFERASGAEAAQLVALADPEKTQQVLLNLLSNAVKFTPAGGRIALRAQREGGRIQVQVADTGVGIAATRVDDIFEPFVQVDTSLTRTADGTGLGLAISRALAREMDGDLTVRSVVGEG
ncbi:MAG TPA: GAF domain-containing protein, partial [Gemmatimonadaceae bacterium]